MKIIVHVNDDAEDHEVDYLREAIDQCDATGRVEVLS